MPEAGTGKGVKILKNLEGHAKEAELDLVFIFKGDLNKEWWCASLGLRGLILGAVCRGGWTPGPSFEVRRPGRWLLQWPGRNRLGRTWSRARGVSWT